MGGKIPKTIAEAPELLLGLGLYLDGFKDLGSERTESGQIPWSAINYYCKALELSADQTESMHYHMVSMDEAFGKWQAKKDKSNKGKE